MLDLAPQEPPFHVPLKLPERRKNPTAAFLMSLLWPGLGHIYLGEVKKAAWLVALQILGLVFTLGNSQWEMQGILMVPAIYCFGFTDAYYSAREWNAGAQGLLVGANPRVAGLINFLTHGIGYFYLGQQGKGLISFFAVTAIQSWMFVSESPWIIFLAFSIPALLAADAYRIGRQQLAADYPGLKTEVLAAANPGGIPVQIPVIVFVCIATLSALGFGVLKVLSSRFITHRGGQIERSESGVAFRQLQEQVSLTVPSDWEPWQAQDALVAFRGGACNVLLMDRYGMESLRAAQAINIHSLQKQHPDGLVNREGVTAESSRFNITFKTRRDRKVRQTFLQRRRGLKLFTLIETEFDDGCRQEMASIEASWKL